MSPLPKFLCTALLSALALVAAPAAKAQVGVSITIGAPAWGPPVPYGVQYYYIPEIDGYYDLYSQQYIVFQDGYWVPLPELYGYDPYQFHPVIIDYRGREPWQQLSYCHSHYAYQPYRAYGPSRGGYYTGGYGRPYYGRSYDYRGGYYDNRGYYNNRGNYDNSRSGQYPGGNRGYNNGPRQNGGHGFPPNRGGNRGNPVQNLQPPQFSQSQRGARDNSWGNFDRGRGDQELPDGGNRDRRARTR